MLTAQKQTAINNPVKAIKKLDTSFDSNQNGNATEPKNICPILANIPEIVLILFFDSIH